MSIIFLLFILFSIFGCIIFLLYLCAHIFVKLWDFLRWYFRKCYQHIGKKKTILYHLLGLGLSTTCIIFTIFFLIPYQHYQNACDFMENHQYHDAVLAFHDLGDFLDSPDRLRISKEELLNNPSVGDTIFFGTYEQDYNTENGMEELEWIVLERQDHKLLLLSKSILVIGQYRENNFQESAPFSAIWETSSIRDFLNNDFLTLAFSPAERSHIQETALTTPIHTNLSDTPDNLLKTRETVFLLSKEECERYFSDRFHGIANTTLSASASLLAPECAKTSFLPSLYRRCIEDSVEPITYSWYLRDSGFSYDENVCTVFTAEGSFSHIPSEHKSGIRPALWMDIRP